MSKPYWHTMRSVDDVLTYANRLGFGISREHRSPGWIVRAQIRLCAVYDALLAKAGSLPFDVHYTRKHKRFWVRIRVAHDRGNIHLPVGSLDYFDASKL